MGVLLHESFVTLYANRSLGPEKSLITCGTVASRCRTLPAVMKSQRCHRFLSLFAVCHPRLNFCPSIHCSRVSTSIVREWTLARCGHHPFLDGHTSQARSCLCGAAAWSFAHALRACALFEPWRRHRCHVFGLRSVGQLPDEHVFAFAFLAATPVQHCGLDVSPYARRGWRVPGPVFIAGRHECVR